ncbi:MAG: HD domain-containing protein [Planctomycetes bacterium]|nr:HD domain-containing protein [Planctomycetota bacterium]
MEQEQLEKLKIWFDEYVAGFYGDDEKVNANIKLKDDHSRRTAKEMLYLAEELKFDENQKRISEVIGLFHDVGRFEQFAKYRTYSDPKSCNHSLLGAEILRRTKILEQIDSEERNIIQTAVKFHGAKELPKNLDEKCQLFAKLIRDADKIDILYVIIEYYKQYRDNPQGFTLELDLPDEPGYSKELLDDVLKGKRTDYKNLQTLNDMKILPLGWVYDINFVATFKCIRQRKLLEKLVDFLPDTEDIRAVEKKVFSYVDLRIEREDK